jgi:hypothetical protein
MQITLDIPETMIARVRGTPVERSMKGLGPEALQYIFAYGFQRVNNDAGAVGKDDSLADALAKSGKKWDALVEGKTRVNTPRETDPVRGRALEIALAKTLAAMKAKGLKADPKDVKLRAKKLFDDNTEKLLAMAREDIARQAALELEIDLGLDEAEIDEAA